MAQPLKPSPWGTSSTRLTIVFKLQNLQGFPSAFIQALEYKLHDHILSQIRSRLDFESFKQYVKVEVNAQAYLQPPVQPSVQPSVHPPSLDVHTTNSSAVRISSSSEVNSLVTTSPESSASTWHVVRTKYDSVFQSFSQTSVRRGVQNLLQLPARNPLRENPFPVKQQKGFTLRRKTNLQAVVVQVCGIRQDGKYQCVQCASMKGIWDRCVIMDKSVSSYDPLHGACANCFYNGNGHRCSYKYGGKYRDRQCNRV